MPSQSGGGSGGGSVIIDGVVAAVLAGTPNVAVTSHVPSDTQILASAARTTTQTVDFDNPYWHGMILVVDVTSPGTGSITPSIGALNPITSTVIPLWTAAAAITTTVQRAYLFYPGCVTNASASSGLLETFNCALPKSIRVTITANNANSITYSVAALRCN